MPKLKLVKTYDMARRLGCAVYPGGYMMRFCLPVSALALTAALGGCATITRGTTTQFTIDSSPPAAQATTSTGFYCAATPCTFRVPLKDSFIVTVSKVGYTSSQTKVSPSLAEAGTAGFLGNALVGGVIGAGVDIGSGAMMDLKPNPLHVDLQPVAPAPPPEPPSPAAAPAQGSPATTVPAPTKSPTPAASQ